MQGARAWKRQMIFSRCGMTNTVNDQIINNKNGNIDDVAAAGFCFLKSQLDYGIISEMSIALTNRGG